MTTANSASQSRVRDPRVAEQPLSGADFGGMTIICATCGVEAAEGPPATCPICADERQYVPAAGQRWTSLAELRESGQQIRISELEPDLWGLNAPRHGIGHTALVVRSNDDVVLWDPIGYLDDVTVDFVSGLGRTRAVVASHPHMYGVQVDWGEALDALVLVNARDQHWVQRRDDRLQVVDGTVRLLPDLILHRLGGHFAGSQVLEWSGGAGGRGTLLASDTIGVNPDRKTVAFLRSYPNRIPLSADVTMRLARAVQDMHFDRCVNNFGGVLEADAKDAIMRSAERHVAWVSGVNDADC